MVQEEWIIGMSEDYIFSKKWVFDKSMIIIDLLENVVIAVYESKLVVAFAAGLVVKVKGVFSY